MAVAPAPAPGKPKVDKKEGKLFVNEGALFGVVQIKGTEVQGKNTVTLEGPHGGPNGGGVCTPLAKHEGDYYFGVYIPNYGNLKQGEMAPANISFTITNEARQTSPYPIPLVLQEIPNGIQAFSVS